MVTSEKKNWKKDWRCVETTEKHVKNRETGEKQVGEKKHIENTSLPQTYLPLIRRSKKESLSTLA